VAVMSAAADPPECFACNWPPNDYPDAPCNLGPVGCCEWADACLEAREAALEGGAE
jgi:hypothetical protein